jgi:uncharacterized protein YbjT (DUF2867 family)
VINFEPLVVEHKTLNHKGLKGKLKVSPRMKNHFITTSMIPKHIMKKTAVIFGASGLVGKELCKILSEDSEFEEILIVVRTRQESLSPKIKQLILPDFSQLSDHKDSMKADLFFCCIGTTIKKAGSQESFRKVDLDIPVAVAAIAQLLSVNSLVVISSLGANEKSSNFYLRTKGQMERQVAEKYHGDLKFVRPSLLMGDREEFRFGEKFAVVFMKAFGWLFAGPMKRYRGIMASDVARCMVKISSLPKGKQIYESEELLELAEHTLKNKYNNYV